MNCFRRLVLLGGGVCDGGLLLIEGNDLVSCNEVLNNFVGVGVLED